ncbi:anthranilate synthase component I family protein [Asticcacaulis solisilvae]|uniref:anthranilate synthase component I family protein n=1 Tax=Asticcacaulis solisilvae TaxID=1217274 RepID=UPI003FD7FA84
MPRGEGLFARLSGWFEHTGAAALISGGEHARFSYLMAEPAAETELPYTDAREAAAVLAEATAFVRPQDHRDDLPPFTGGVIGLAGFELGLRLESLKRRPFRIEGRGAWPELVVRLYPAVLAFDHETGRLVAIGRGANEDDARTACERLIALYEATPETRPLQGPLADGKLRLETPDDVHEDKVAAVVRQIHAGDLFQANLARGWTGRLKAGVTPGDIAAALHARGPAPFGAMLRLGERAIVSNSPERFIRLDASGHMETGPIKGTRPRGPTPEDDARLAAELLASAKDRAENLMIVDLMRHDLSRVADIGSVAVPRLNGLETYANVHHLVSTVTAQLAQGRTAADVLTASFPPGSISGAPKVQAMKVIAEMEAARGPYCGSLFFIDAGGAMDSSVLIRTLAFERDDSRVWQFRAAAGGGIVADSDPRDERIETETKLSLIRSVLEGH